MKKSIFLIIAIVMLLLTTVLICLGFVYLEVSVTSLVLITCVSVAGYLTSVLYFIEWKNGYLEDKDVF